ncbi:MAG: hypothetical protein AB7G28_25265 [Pirellulales bacterium]
MSHVGKLSIAVGLALLAAALNAMWLSAEKRPATFVAVSVDVKQGQPLSDDVLTSVPVPGNSDALRESLIPYSGRAILYGVLASRNYAAGDVIFQRDLQAPLELSKFEVLGPFRLISVGERFKNADESAAGAEGGNNVTIAVSANFDERTRRLLEIIDPSRSRVIGNPESRIVAVQVIPKNEQTPDAKLDDKNVVYQTVSLNGIENVPRVLLEGDVVRFVVPASDPF